MSTAADPVWTSRTIALTLAGSAAAIALVLAQAPAVSGEGGGGGEPPAPPVIDPGPAQASPAKAPSDAVVLMDGSSLSGWTTMDKQPAPWTLDAASASMTVKPGAGSIVSTYTFNDAQIHIEFATPVKIEGSGQERGNSGVYLQGRYEVQILDSYQNATYPDGQCGAVYQQHVPAVNACRGPGEWQSYDIVFRAARFDAAGTRTAAARVTVFHNGVLIHDNAELSGPTGGSMSEEGPAAGPLMLQDHGNLTRFRNIWIRPLSK